MGNQSQTQPHQNAHLTDVVLNKPYYTEGTHGIPTTEEDSSEKLATALSKVKTELINNKKNILIEKIKKTVIEQVYYSEKQIKVNFSDYLSQKLGYHYTYMANLFAKVNGSSIQNFIIATKIERVKELLIYEGMTLTEVSYKLHYSSVAHLSNQFKKVTGTSPSKYLASIGQIPRTLPSKSPRVIDTNANTSQNEPITCEPITCEPVSYEPITP